MFAKIFFFFFFFFFLREQQFLPASLILPQKGNTFIITLWVSFQIQRHEQLINLSQSQSQTITTSIRTLLGDQSCCCLCCSRQTPPNLKISPEVQYSYSGLNQQHHPLHRVRLTSQRRGFPNHTRALLLQTGVCSKDLKGGQMATTGHQAHHFCLLASEKATEGIRYQGGHTTATKSYIRLNLCQTQLLNCANYRQWRKRHSLIFVKQNQLKICPNTIRIELKINPKYCYLSKINHDRCAPFKDETS